MGYLPDDAEVRRKAIELVGDQSLSEDQRSNLCYLILVLHQLASELKFLFDMPPRRNRNLNDIYEQEFEQRVMARMEERMGQFVDQLTEHMNDLMNQRRPHNRNRRESEDEESENPFGKGDGLSSDEQERQPRRNEREDNRRWESGLRVNIPEFDGDTLNPEGFIDWLVAVEEVFEFKEIPENKRVSLIVTKLRGRASAWWQQLKLTRERVGKLRVTTWQKMKKCMRANFIPHNYQRNDIQETDEQLVSRYIGGLRVQIMDSVNMVDLVTLSDAHQRALAFEKQNRRVGGSSSSAIIGGSSGSGNVTSRFVPNQARQGSSNTGPVSKGVGSSSLKCFNCGEPGHRQSECKKAGKRHLFADPDGNMYTWEVDDVVDEGYEQAPALLLNTKAVGDDWLRHNIFQSTCTISGKITLMPNKPKELANKPTGTLLTLSKFEDELEQEGEVFVLIGKEVAEDKTPQHS
ncbi:reverse transcriptase domain-containing protein [Artemisia annua]|uniref:Reverse transcriptase domain-containing protein n=1 Tax=Artemisia annua TaxID=35608 RepID=A0A2U1PL59_ARTAN|nr:reverse transcriptase domain-containing protein [Artemisia annua]